MLRSLCERPDTGRKCERAELAVGVLTGGRCGAATPGRLRGGGGGDAMRWNAHVDAEWLSDGRSMRLRESLTFLDRAGSIWIASQGIIVDGASIPRFFWRFIGGPFSGRYRRASVIHDAYCQTRERPSRAVHAVFFEMMREDGVGLIKAWLIWGAVRMFGPRFNTGGGL